MVSRKTGIVMENHCQFWLPRKKRFCSNSPLSSSEFCGNHAPRSQEDRVPCPLDPSHSVLSKNLRIHIDRCPLRKQVQALEAQPFYQKGINCMDDAQDTEILYKSRDASSNVLEESNMNSNKKRDLVYKMSVTGFTQLVSKIVRAHASVGCNLDDSYLVPEACDQWFRDQRERQLPIHEKHMLQQASIIGNLESMEILHKPISPSIPETQNDVPCDAQLSDTVVQPAVVEFGAGRGYLTQMLADYYGINQVFLVERRSYKFKADRSLRQAKNIAIERLRVDIEDLNLNAIDSLRRHEYLAVGKHICGSAIDLTLRCCLSHLYSQNSSANLGSSCKFRGLALSTCCHHLCQWRHYINKNFLLELGIMKDDFDAMTWFTSWTVDANYGSILFDDTGQSISNILGSEELVKHAKDVEEVIRNMKAADRARLGVICKDLVDVGRLMWIREHGLQAKLVTYVPTSISPENHLLIAKC